MFFSECDYYILHDGIINDVICEEDKLIFIFNEGIISCKGSSNLDKDKKCKLIINISGLRHGEEYQHISIKKIKKNRIKEIDFLNFIDLVKKNGLRIYLDFYSNFAKAIFLKCNIKDYEIEIIITEILKLNYEFD